MHAFKAQSDLLSIHRALPRITAKSPQPKDWCKHNETHREKRQVETQSKSIEGAVQVENETTAVLGQSVSVGQRDTHVKDAEDGTRTVTNRDWGYWGVYKK